MSGNDPSLRPIDELMKQAVAHHQAGRVFEARRLYQDVLSIRPDHVGALHLGAFAEQNLGDTPKALAMLERAIALRPDDPALHNNLGELLRTEGRGEQAMRSYRNALAVNPDMPAANNNLGTVLRALGQVDASIEHFRRAIAAAPDYPEAHSNLGEALQARGDYDAAYAELMRAAELNPRLPQVWNNLGNWWKRADLNEAVKCYQKALELSPLFMAALNNLGMALYDQGRLCDATDALHKALQLAPQSADAHTNLSLVLGDQGLADDAFVHARQAVALAPGVATFHNNLARALVMRGEFEQAVAEYRQAIQLQPELSDIHSNLLLTLNYRAADPAAMRDEHVAWARAHAPQPSQEPHANARDPDRRLRIGIVSSDFREHAVAYFIEPVLAAHDHAVGELFCYSNLVAGDEVTDRLRELAHAWRRIAGRSDEEVARLIREDQIDILIDLAGHTANHRLGVFALKPAPIQATWIGYPNTTGLTSVDYWITDAHLDPPGQTERYCTERLLRLPETFACYAPPRYAPPVGDLPARRNGHITFVSFNNLIKHGDDVISLWSTLLKELPTARLVLGTRRFSGGQGLGPFIERCKRARMPMDRVRFLPGQHPRQYLESHGDVDIALDSFPFTGHTITLHALWMGVPIVTLAGDTHVSRRGVSLMNNLGLPELIATDPDEYVRIAKDLANDLDRLANFRATLRDRMRASPLVDARRFVKNLSEGLRQIWAQWCH